MNADGLELSDVDHNDIFMLFSSTVTLSSSFGESAEEVLALANTQGLTTSYDASTGVLAIAGEATVAVYQAALRTLEYQNTADEPTPGARRQASASS